jgi:hypothetical protein
LNTIFLFFTKKDEKKKKSDCIFAVQFKRNKNRMKFTEKLYSLEKIAQFIRQEKTGDPQNFATKCGLSKDVLFDQIDILRQLAARNDAKILYDRNKKTYYFEPYGRFTDFKFAPDG